MKRLRCGYLDPLETSTFTGLTIIAVIGAVLICAGFYIGAKAISLSRYGNNATGTVTEHRQVEHNKKGKQSVSISSAVDFLDESGSNHRMWIGGNHAIGESIPVIYLPDRPEVAARAGDNSDRIGAAVFIMIGAAIFLGAIWGVTWLRARRSMLQELISRVSPLSATVLYLSTNITRTNRDGATPRTSRSYRFVAQAEIEGEKIEFESYCYGGAPPLDVGTVVTLYVDPRELNFYYLQK